MKYEIDTILKEIPCCIALVDIADCKRRNLSLGYKVVDDDISELKKYAELSGGKIIANYGPKLLIVFENKSKIHVLIKKYYKTEKYTDTEIFWSEKDGKRVEKKLSLDTEILRSLRCFYFEVENSNDISENIAKMEKNMYKLVPNEPKNLLNYDLDAKISSKVGGNWKCMKELEYRLECQFCGSYDYEVVQSDVEYGYKCKKCNAAIGSETKYDCL